MIARNARSACSLLASANRCGTVSWRMVPRRATCSPQDDILSGLLKIQTTPFAKGRSRKAARKRCIQRASNSRIPCQTREVHDFHSPATRHNPDRNIRSLARILRNPPPARLLRENDFAVCTISGQGAVHGVHSIENTCSYKCVFSIDEKNRRSTTRSFFDSFLSFSGWCGVRGSSVVTVLIARLGWRARKGL